MSARGRESRKYEPRDFEPFAVTVDIAVFTIAVGVLKVLLIRRGIEPFRGAWALPGGFVKPDESVDGAANRELLEETGVGGGAHLRQFHAYGDPKRDPRMRVVTVAYLALIPDVGGVRAGSDAAEAELVSVNDVVGRRPRLELAFDHLSILSDGLDILRSDIESPRAASAFLGKAFTLSELRLVHEAVLDRQLDPANFRRKVLGSGELWSTDRWTSPGRGGGRPAEIYSVVKPRR